MNAIRADAHAAIRAGRTLSGRIAPGRAASGNLEQVDVDNRLILKLETLDRFEVAFALSDEHTPARSVQLCCTRGVKRIQQC